MSAAQLPDRRLLVLASKPRGLSPSQRFRLEQWAPGLASDHGITLDFAPFESKRLADILYQQGPLPVADICDALPDQLSGSAVRAMLKRLEDKGYVQRTDSDRGYLYSPAVSETAAKKSALSDVVKTFFNGSPASAASALLGMSDKLDNEQLDELEQMIARARAAKGGK